MLYSYLGLISLWRSLKVDCYFQTKAQAFLASNLIDNDKLPIVSKVWVGKRQEARGLRVMSVEL
jgi:hypothetical protein